MRMGDNIIISPFEAGFWACCVRELYVLLLYRSERCFCCFLIDVKDVSRFPWLGFLFMKIIAKRRALAVKRFDECLT